MKPIEERKSSRATGVAVAVVWQVGGGPSYVTTDEEAARTMLDAVEASGEGAWHVSTNLIIDSPHQQAQLAGRVATNIRERKADAERKAVRLVEDSSEVQEARVVADTEVLAQERTRAKAEEVGRALISLVERGEWAAANSMLPRLHILLRSGESQLPTMVEALAAQVESQSKAATG